MKKCLFLSFTIISIVILCILGVVRISANLEFKNNCGGYLERASNATSIELAIENLDKAINYLEKNNLTEGQVSIFLRQPKNDITYWYKNLTKAKEQLYENKDKDLSPLEESNVLMKLRETVTDTGSDGTKLVVPDGISVYPNNALYFWLCIMSLIAFSAFGILTMVYWYD